MSYKTARRMPRVENIDQMFLNSKNTLILNKIDFTVPNYGATITEKLFSRPSDIDFIARCECGHLEGNFYIGEVCPKCHTEVTMDMEAMTGHLDHKIWIQTPPEVASGWLNPTVYVVLSEWLKYSRKRTQKEPLYHGNWLDDILDPSSAISHELQGVITGKGFTYFYENFNRIIEYFAYQHPTLSKKDSTQEVIFFLNKYRDCIFCHHYPVLSSSLHSIVMADGVSDTRKRYVDDNCKYVLSAVSILSYLNFSPTQINAPQKAYEIATYQAFKELLKYDADVQDKHFSHKKAIPRQHIFGSRLHLTFRGVISPITGVHCMDELHMPWGMLLNTLRLQIINKLFRKGYSYSQAYNKHQNALQCYDKEIDDVLMDLMQECPYKGFPALLNRNPSLKSSSIQGVFITKFFRDPTKKSMAVSPMAMPGMNGDFDGDELNGVLLVETESVEAFSVLSLYNQYLARNKMEVNNLITVPKMDLVLINSFLGRV